MGLAYSLDVTLGVIESTHLTPKMVMWGDVVLALTDESLARIMTAATAVPRRSRGRWLRKLAGEVRA